MIYILLYYWIPCNIFVYFFVISPLSFCAQNNLDKWYQSKLLLVIFQFMSPTRSEYRKLGLKLASLEENLSRTPKKPSMVKEKRNNGVEDSINLLLEQALTRHRDEMMENFSQILRRLPIIADVSSSRNHFGGTAPFKVQVNFDILIFEG
jgi:hypothetical protein